jgi:hypothetical protein
MRTLFLIAAFAGFVCMGAAPAKAVQHPISWTTASKAQLRGVEEVGLRRRYYRRHGYPVPYAYPPAYGYYAPPAYGYYAPVDPAYPYAPYPYRYYRPYYALYW